MDLENTLNANQFVLTEAAVIESLRRDPDVVLHPRLENALAIYDRAGRSALRRRYQGFIVLAQEAGVPITICTPTWRANYARLAAAGIQDDVNADAVRFLKRTRAACSDWAARTFIGGLIGCKNDCYRPEQALSSVEARDFHRWQIQRLVSAGVDFLLAATLPSLSEATGIALAMAETKVPYIISFVINRHGSILDGCRLVQAFAEIDAVCARRPLGYMVNCAYPSFLNAADQPEPVFSRLLGFQGNASSLDHADLDGAGALKKDDIADWGARMIEMNRRWGVKILGGCCGTGCEHLRYIVQNINRTGTQQMI